MSDNDFANGMLAVLPLIRWLADEVDRLQARVTELEASSRKRKPREPVTEELLATVAEAYLGAAPGRRSVAVATAIGLDKAHSASYYINRAREVGLLEPVSGDMRVEKDDGQES